jgi:hypothetical protein
MHVVTIAALVAVLWAWSSGRHAVVGTTLLAAWRFGLAAAAISLVAAVLEWCQSLQWGEWGEWANTVSPAAVDHLWYAACVLWLCPAVAVLGARRPGHGAWCGFVMIPLLLVLEWPVTGVAVAGWVSGARLGPVLEGVRLDWPERIGWLIVLVLGTGNYLLTRRWAAVLGGAGGVLAMLWPLTGLVTDGEWSGTVRLTGSVVLAASLCWAGVGSRGVLAETDGDRRRRLDWAWGDFVEAYGLVWAVRLSARVNEELQRISGGGVLGPGGIEFADGDRVSDAERDAVYCRAEETLRWLWSRFVDEAWVESRLGAGPPLGAKERQAL